MKINETGKNHVYLEDVHGKPKMSAEKLEMRHISACKQDKQTIPTTRPMFSRNEKVYRVHKLNHAPRKDGGRQTAPISPPLRGTRFYRLH